jgi:hypothetical protein
MPAVFLSNINMKYSNVIGIVAALLLIVLCYAPWVHIPSLNMTLNGVRGRVNADLNFGRQIISYTFFAAFLIWLFLTPRLWAKRVNVFVGALQLGWTIKNFLIFTGCRLGECPEKKYGIYLVLLLSILVFIMTLLPKLDLKEQV